MKKQKDDKRSPGQKLVDSFFEQHMDVALKPFSDFCMEDFSRVLTEFQGFAKKRQEADLVALSKIGRIDPDSIEAVGKEATYALPDVVERFTRNLMNARMQVANISAETILKCFKGINNE